MPLCAQHLNKDDLPPAPPELLDADAARRPRQHVGFPAKQDRARRTPSLVLHRNRPPAAPAHGLASLSLPRLRIAAAQSPPPPKAIRVPGVAVALACHLDCLASPTATTLLLACFVFLSAGLQHRMRGPPERKTFQVMGC